MNAWGPGSLISRSACQADRTDPMADHNFCKNERNNERNKEKPHATGGQHGASPVPYGGNLWWGGKTHHSQQLIITTPNSTRAPWPSLGALFLWSAEVMPSLLHTLVHRPGASILCLEEEGAEPNQPGKDVYWGSTFRGWLP
jgi:hypothetical protein